MDEQEELRVVEGFICYECAHEIYAHLPEDDQHDDECPTQTNYWMVDEQHGINCDLCTARIPYGGTHRFIPRLPEDEVDEDGTFLGTVQPGGTPLIVCLACSTFRLVLGGDHGESGY